jgi:plastocyanin
MNKDERKHTSTKRRVAVFSAIAAGSVAAILAGLVINSVVPRASFTEDVLHPPRSVTVSIPQNAWDSSGNASFSPREIAVVLGTNNTVVWLNNSPDPERVIGADERMAGGFGQTEGLIRPGGSWAFTFTEPGVYDYNSDIHPWLKGTVVVKGADSQIEKIGNGPTRIVVTSPESDEVGNKDFDIKEVGFTSDGHPFVSVYGTPGGTTSTTPGLAYAYGIMVDQGNYFIASHAGLEDSIEVEDDTEWHAHTFRVFSSTVCGEVGLTELVATEDGKALVTPDKVVLMLDPVLPTTIYEVSTLRYTITTVTSNSTNFDSHVCVDVMGLDNIYVPDT